MSQYFEVLRSKQEYVHKDRVIDYIVGIERTLTKAMELQSKNPGSKITVRNY